MEDIRSMIVDILKRGELMSLTTNDGSGVWVSDLDTTSDDNLNIYWISRTSTRHSKLVLIRKS